MEPIEKDDHFISDGMNAFERNVKRYGIDALGAMAQGLFCSLLIGTMGVS